MKNRTKIAVFASGNGSNFQAIADAIERGELNAELVLAVTDKPHAYVVGRAAKAGIEALAFTPSDYGSKEQYEKMLDAELKKRNVEWIVLAGFMRLIGPVLLEAYSHRIVNIHPSVLPDFPGKDAIGQTMAAESEFAGVTVHYVDAGMDTGAIISQNSFPVNGRSREEVEEQIHKIEHQLYPQTLQQLFNR